MSVEVEAAPVSTAHNLNPTVRRLALRVPAIASIMRHLVLKVLSEPEVVLWDPDCSQVLVDSGQEIPAESWI